METVLISMVCTVTWKYVDDSDLCVTWNHVDVCEPGSCKEQIEISYLSCGQDILMVMTHAVTGKFFWNVINDCTIITKRDIEDFSYNSHPLQRKWIHY